MPFDTSAKPSGAYSRIVQGDGDQTDPSIDAQFIVYASNASGNWDVLLYTIGGDPLIRVVAGGPGDQDQPDVNQTTLAYRVADGIVLANWEFGNVLRAPPARDPAPAFDPSRQCQAFDPVSQPVVTSVLATWECGRPGARNIEVARYAGRLEEYELTSPAGVAGAGDQFGAAAFEQYVAFVDGADGGSVWLHDTTPGSRETRFVCDGRATGVAVGALGGTVLAVTRASNGHDADVEIWDAEGQLVTSLRVDGVQQNPHLSGDWAAFEDLSTGRSQVVLWQWTTGLVFVPHPSASNQTLNDLGVVAGAEVRVVFADDVDGSLGNRDIALYRLAYVNGAIPDDGTGNGDPWLPPPPPPPPPVVRPAPARCDDADPTVLGTLELGREPARPLAAAVSFDATPFPGDADLPVLVCIDSSRVTAGWVTLDDAAIASPADFNAEVTHLEVRAVAEAGAARIAGTIAGKPGSWLVARVLADPGRTMTAAGSPAGPGTTLLARAAASAGSLHGAGAGGCGTGGAAGPLAGLALLLALRLRRR